jgi:hypothetical protein
MQDIDRTLMAKAAPYFLDAIATFGRPGDDLVRVAQEITQAGKIAGFTKDGRRKMLKYLYTFVEELKSSGTDPFLRGRPASDPASLFSSDRLGGLFNDRELTPMVNQDDLFGASGEDGSQERAQIDQLIAATKLYDSSEAVKELLDFTIRLRELAPFNGMLLHIQKPGVTHVATAYDWWHRFGRVPKKGTRPLLILRTMGPVDFVFDILDTEGHNVPDDAFAFPTFGNLSEAQFNQFMRMLAKEKIDVITLDSGDGQAGWIRFLSQSKTAKGKNTYELAYNKNHPVPTRLVTVAHELAHLYLGHLGADVGRRVPDRQHIPDALMEVEAEIVAFLVAMRNGLKPRSESYLANYKGAFQDLNLYGVTRAANAIETVMGISAQRLWNEKG